MAAKYNFSLDQGTTLAKSFQLDMTTVDFTSLDDVDICSQLRKTYDAEDVLATFHFVVADAEAGVFIMELSAEETSAIPAGVWLYDIEFENKATGVVMRLLEGKVTVKPEVTRCEA